MLSKVGMDKKQPPMFIMNEFQKYGITPSGDKEADIAALKAAKEANGESTAQIENFEMMMEQRKEMKAQRGEQGEKPQGAQGAPPWANLMQSLGLELQGSKEADFAAMSAKLTQLSSAAGSPEQQANLESLNAQYEYYYSQV